MDRLSLGFSIAMHCSTKVLKEICFFLAGPSTPVLDAPLRSWSLPVDPEASLEVVPWDTRCDVPSCDEPSSAMMRGGEFLRNGLPRMLMWVSLLVWTSGGRVGGALAMLWGSTSSSSSSLSG